MMYDILPDSWICYLQNKSISRRLLHRILQHRSNLYVKRIEPFINNSETIIDIGAGPCTICEILAESHSMTPIDVKNLSVAKNIKPAIYDGENIPYEDESHDVALILGVLHHTQNPSKIIKEASRVAKRIIIMEDIYSNTFNKYLTYAMDCVSNLQFTNHPHNNKTDRQWRLLFRKLGLKIRTARYSRSAAYSFKHAIYVLEQDE